MLTDCSIELVQICIFEEEEDLRLLYVGQVGMSLRENNRVLLMVASQGVESNMAASDMSVVCNL